MTCKTDDGDQVPVPIQRQKPILPRRRDCAGSDRKTAVDHVAYEKTRNTDTTLRLNGEEDTLYDDGLEVEDHTGPLTGKDGRDDTDDT